MASAQVYTTSNVVKENKYIKVGDGDNNLDFGPSSNLVVGV